MFRSRVTCELFLERWPATVAFDLLLCICLYTWDISASFSGAADGDCRYSDISMWNESIGRGSPCTGRSMWEVLTCLMIITWSLTRAGCAINRADTWLPAGLIIILHLSLTSSYFTVEPVPKEHPESSSSILLPWRTFSLWFHRCYIGILRRRMRD